MKHGTSHIFTPQITCDGALVWLVFALPDDLRAFDPLPMLQTVSPELNEHVGPDELRQSRTGSNLS